VEEQKNKNRAKGDGSIFLTWKIVKMKMWDVVKNENVVEYVE
jgi:hypothetical protein